MFSDRTSSGDEDEQALKNFELFSILRKKMSQDRIIKSITKCLQNGAEINAINSIGKTVLDIARDEHYDDLVALLSELGGKAALDLAKSGNTRSQHLIQQSISIDAANNQGLLDGNDIPFRVNFRINLRDFSLPETELMLKRVDEEGNTLLSDAAKNGSKDVVDFFIRHGIDINHRNILNKSAIDLAWENKHYDIVVRLLRANSDFPSYFDLSVLNEEKVQRNLKEFVESRNNFHKLIKENRLGNVKDYRHATRKSMVYLNSEGQSALFTAIENKRFEIFVFLQSAGFTFKNEDEENCVKELTRGEKDILKTKMISKFPQIEQGHILYLTSKSRSEKPVDKERIENLYRSLDAIPEVSIILKVIQCIDYLDIVFDFDNEKIKHVNSVWEASEGTTDYKNGIIYIAGKVEENKLLGTLAHELTHLAMYKLYKNDCNPFEKSEDAKKQVFANIAAKIKEYTENTGVDVDSSTEDSPLVTLARAFKYSEDEQQCELIVRIPHILAQYGDEGRKWLLNTNNEIKALFDFYTDETEGGTAYRYEELITNSYLIKPRICIQVLNEYLEETKNIIKYGINFENPIYLDSFLISNKQVFLLKTENTLLSIINIYDSLKNRNRNYSTRDSLFLNFNSCVQKRDEINNLFFCDVVKMLCIRYSYDSNKERLSEVSTILNTLVEQKSDKKIIFIISDSKAEEFNIIKTVFNDKCHEETTDRKFTLNDLTTESQKKLLEREVILQGERISLEKLIDKSDKNAKQIIDAEMLEGLITNKVIKIGNSALDTIDLEGAHSQIVDEVNMETFIDELLSEKSSDIYIISGIPGVLKENELIEYLLNADMDDTKRSRVDDLKSRIAVLRDTTKAINNRIQLTDDLFNNDVFREICKNNRERKIYWINLKHQDNVSKFMLEQIYNPDFYLKSDRFNNQVVIAEAVKEQITSSALTEVFIIGGKTKEEVTRWFQFRDDEERLGFETNYRHHRIMLLNSEVNMLTTFQEQVAENHSQTFHLLKFEQDQLIWCKTYGSLKMLCKYSSKDQRSTKRLIGEDALITEIKDDKVVILAGDSGMGKSTTLVKLFELEYALRSGAKMSIIKSHWLITVNLIDHLDAIRDIDFNEPRESVKQITDFLSKVDKTISGDFARGLLRLALGKRDFGKPLLIAFDGFDEVMNEADRKKVLTLLQRLKDETRAKFWIITRCHYQQMLESAVSKFAINLDPISDETASEFIKKYLKNCLSLILSREEFRSIFGNSDEVTTRMQVYIKALISKMHEVFESNVSNIIGTPLQLYLMLEGSTRYFKEWMRDVNGQSPDFSYLGNDIWEVYENFTHRKHSIYFGKTNIKEQQSQEDNKIIFDYYHKGLTKCFILHTSAPKLYLERFRDIALSAGIIRSNGSNIEFIHPTFGNYFAAKVFLRWIAKWRPENQYKFLNSGKQEYFLKEILLKPDYQVIRTFLNNKLLKEKMANIHLQEEPYLQEVLFLAANESNIGIVRFVLDNSNSTVNAKNNGGSTMLHIAATSGNYDMVKFLVNERKADLAARDNNGNTVLHMAVALDNLDIVKYLTGKGCNVNAKNKHDMSILHLVIITGSFKLLKFLINVKQADLNVILSNGLTILHTAAAYGNLDMVKFLVDEKHIDFDAKNDDDMAVVHMAAMYGNLEVLKFLINEKGANFNVKNKNGESVLETAAYYGNLDTIKFLVDEKKVDFEANSNEGLAVSHTAVMSDNLKMLKFLVNEKGVDFEARNIDGTTILNSAAAANNLDILKFLVNERGANLDTTDCQGRTVLHTAVIYGLLNTVKYLVNEAGADLNAKDKCGFTVFHMAVNSGNLSVVKFLINQKEADLNARSNDGMTVLHVAAKSGYLNIVKYLINEKGADSNATSYDGMTVLHAAAACGKLNVVKFLINQRMANFIARTNDGSTVVHMAIESGNLELIKFLIKQKDADFRARNIHGETILHIAAGSGDLDVLKFLINEKMVDFNTRDNQGRTILHAAVECGHLDTVKFLLNETGADFNAITYDGITILHVAARYGNLKMVKFLIKEKKAHFNVKTDYGDTVLHMAARCDNLNVIKFLINKKVADLNTKNNQGETVLHTAATSGLLDAVKYLVNEAGADLNAVDNDGMTILHAAIISDNLELVKFLINEKEADLDAKENNGMTALYMAAYTGVLDMVEFLVNEKNVDFEAKNDHGWTVLHMAAKSGNLNMVKFLVDEKGANVNACNDYGLTVLHVAAQFGKLEIVKFLINEQNADFNAKDAYGCTILHTAAYSGHLDIVKFLINDKQLDFESEDISLGTVLHEVVRSGNLEMIKFLVDERNADFNDRDYIGKSILHTAAASGHLHIVKFLINDKEANFNAHDKLNRSVLHTAAASGHLRIVKFLINDKQADFNSRDKLSRTVLHKAAGSGNFDMVKFLIDEKGTDFNAIDKEGSSVVHTAARYGNLNIVKFLINEKGADFITNDYIDTSILHKAARSGNLDLVKFLINKKVNLNAMNHADVAVVHEAALSGKLEIVKYLINEKNVAFNVTDYDEQTLLHKAAVRGKLDMLKFLVDEKELDFNVVDTEGVSVLHTAARHGNLEVLKFLINEKGADFNVKDNRDRTLLHAAVRFDNLDTVKFLVNETMLDCNATDISSISVLDMAACCGSLECIKFILDEEKVYFNPTGDNSWNCFEMACIYGRIDIVEYLLNKQRVDLNRQFIIKYPSLRQKVRSKDFQYILHCLGIEDLDF